MMTTGQGWMMALPGWRASRVKTAVLEAVAYAWREQSFVPAEAVWEKAPGQEPARWSAKKHFQIVGRGAGAA